MNRKKGFVLGTVCTIALLFAACGGESDITPSSTPSPVPTQEAAEPTPTVKVELNADYATEELLSNPDSYQEFVDSTSEYQLKVVFTANTAVREFKYLELGLDEENQSEGDFHFIVVKELYTTEELSQEKSLVIAMVLEGLIPNRGISYLDENGTTKYFTIGTSGEDGSVLLSEITISK